VKIKERIFKTFGREKPSDIEKLQRFISEELTL
jgi:hypothetical protein